jgi:hypothetical protein
VGELDFFLQRPRSFLARADAPAELLVLPRPEFERMAAQAPELATLLQVRQFQGVGPPGIAWSGLFQARGLGGAITCVSLDLLSSPGFRRPALLPGLQSQQRCIV